MWKSGAVRGRRAEVDRIVAEPAVAGEIEPRDPHARGILVGGAQMREHVLGALAAQRTRRISANSSASRAEQVLARLPGGRWPRRSSAIVAQLVLERLRPGDFLVPSARAVRRSDRSSAASAARGSSQASSILSIQVLPSRRRSRRASSASLSASQRSRQASGVAARERQAGDEMLARRRRARRRRAPSRSASAPPASPRRRQDRPRRAETRRRSSGAPRAKSRRSSPIVTSVADFGPASLMSRPCGLPGMTIVALPCSTNR